MLKSTVLALALTTTVLAQPFELVVTVSPPGSNTNPATWQPVKRFAFETTGSPALPLADIPTSQVSDPAGAVFRTPTDLFISNRHGNVLGQGSISRFTLSNDGLTATPSGTLTAAGLIGVHELAVSPTTGELFAATVFDGIFRFTFDAGGNPSYAGRFAQGVPMRGVLVHPNGQFIYATSANSLIRVYRIESNGSVTTLPTINPPGANNLHFFCLGPTGDELYVGDIGANRVYRYAMLPDGSLVAKPSIPASSPIDLAFSASGTEMFTGNHFAGGITRFTYTAATDSWAQSGTIATPSMGGFATYVQLPCGNTDVGRQGGVRGADGLLDNNDFVVFIDLFFENDPRTDFGTTGGTPGSDGLFNNNDFIVYIDQFFNGCF